MKKRILPLLLALSLLLSVSAYAVQTEEGPRIAVIDTGVSSAAVDTQRLEQGKNYILPDESTEDMVGHGTAVASIILGNELAGVPGLCPTATVVPLVYYTQKGSAIVKGDMAMLAQCILDAVDVYNCDIINISSGALNPTAALKDAVAYATANALWEGFCRVDGETTTDVRGWAMETGVSDGTNGEGAITRARMATMFYRYAGLIGCDTTLRADMSRFADAEQIPDYAVDAMSWAVAAGLMNGTSAVTVSPDGTATRAQLATILVRFCQGIEK